MCTVNPPLIVGRYKIETIDAETFSVTNTDKSTTYTVLDLGLGNLACDCTAGSYGRLCGHKKAVQESGLLAPLPDDEETAIAPVECTVIINSEARREGDIPLMSVPGVVTHGEGKGSSFTINGIELDLTLDQERALRAIASWLGSGKSREMSLLGWAGTGKTTVMMALAYGLKEYGLSFYQIIFVTPTHKAKRVIQEKLDYFGLRVQTTTIHSLLGIKALHNGKELSFQPLTTRSFDIRDYKLVICDEGSMVESELHEYMQDALVRSPSTRVLWVGDDCQALPVGEAKIASTLRLPDRYQLSQVVRYGGAIGEIAKSLRDAIDSPELPTFRTNCSEDKTEGFLRLKKADWEKRILEEFLRPEYKKNSNHIRAIAYTNNRVQQLNDMIRSALYPNAPEFIVGERLIAQEGIIFNKYDDSGAIQNSDELIVTAITEGEMEGFECWYLSLTGDSGDYGGVPVLKAHKVTAHKERLNELASQKLWQKFWYLKTECFANLRYAYALTAHKSQGSTYRIAAVDMTNLSMMPRDKKTGKFLRTHRERNSLIYTAITRASHLVIAH